MANGAWEPPGDSGVPNRQGFDEFYGLLDQKHAHTQYPTQMWENEDEIFLDGNFGPLRKDYAQDLFTNRALSFIEKNKAAPFFLYLSYTTPHANNELTRQTGNGMELPGDHPYTDKSWPKPDRDFAGVVAKLDRDVGSILAKVRELGIEEDTLVLFASDNGPHKEGGNNPELFDSNGPLRGIKRDLYDGGIRTPFLARWPGKIQAGQVSDQVCAFWDMLPTLAEISGGKAPADIDGISVRSRLPRPKPAGTSVPVLGVSRSRLLAGRTIGQLERSATEEPAGSDRAIRRHLGCGRITERRGGSS